MKKIPAGTQHRILASPDREGNDFGLLFSEIGPGLVSKRIRPPFEVCWGASGSCCIRRKEQIASICNLVAEYFEGNPQKTALWFRTPNPMLGNVSPRDMIRLGRYQRLLQFIVHARAENQPTHSE